MNQANGEDCSENGDRDWSAMGYSDGHTGGKKDPNQGEVHPGLVAQRYLLPPF